MKNSYQVRAQKTWNILKNYVLGCGEEEHLYQRAVRAFNRDYHRKVELHFGSVRMCFVTSDYVIKMNYREDRVMFFGGCEEEYKRYQDAYENDCENAFCPIDKLDEYAYVMPRCKIEDYWDETDVATFWNECSDDECSYVEYYVGDIHGQNVGKYRGRIVLIDYACANQRTFWYLDVKHPKKERAITRPRVSFCQVLFR